MSDRVEDEKPKKKRRNRLTVIEREAIGMVLQERMAGDTVQFFTDACGVEPARAEKLSQALESGAMKI